jgi:hypothetical protein
MDRLGINLQPIWMWSKKKCGALSFDNKAEVEACSAGGNYKHITMTYME